MTGCKLCHRLLLGLLTATLAVLGLQLTPTACPERQLSLTVCLQIIITPLMIAITITAHPRPPTDKGSQPRGGPAPGDSKGATLRSGYKDKAANSGIGDNYAHSLSWRTSNKQWAPSLILAPCAHQSPAQSRSPGGGAQELHSPFPKTSHSWEFSIAGRLQRPHVSLRLRCSKGRNRVSSQPNTNSGGNFCADFTTSK